MTKIFTMVKGEADVVTDWVLYHGTIFGFKNLYIIDNLSLDGTWQVLQKLKSKYNINIYRLPDYKKKGEYMTNFMRSFCGKFELAFPINIDEFIVCYDKNTNNIYCDNYSFSRVFKQLPLAAVYKMNYINCKLLGPDGYQRATLEATNGVYVNYGANAKSFFNSTLFNGNIDHGNHYNTNKYVITDLCLVHYHCQNLQQFKKKIYNNVSGFGYNPLDLPELKKKCAPNNIGYKNIRLQVDILENNYKIVVTPRSNTDINLLPISRLLVSLNIPEPTFVKDLLLIKTENDLPLDEENITMLIEELPFVEEAIVEEAIEEIVVEDPIIDPIVEAILEAVVEDPIIEEPIVEDPIIEANIESKEVPILEESNIEQTVVDAIETPIVVDTPPQHMFDPTTAPPGCAQQ